MRGFVEGAGFRKSSKIIATVFHGDGACKPAISPQSACHLFTKMADNGTHHVRVVNVIYKRSLMTYLFGGSIWDYFTGIDSIRKLPKMITPIAKFLGHDGAVIPTYIPIVLS